MLKLNQEYTYKKICKELGWKESSGGQKQKQIKEIESSFEFYHPENKKTHKPKKSYIFTKQLKEPELEDKRKTNSGVKRVPDGVFEYLFKCVLSSGVQRNEYHQRGEMTNIYISSSVIYREFGFDVYGILHSMALHFESATTAGYAKVSRIFQEICINTVRSQTITRICRKLGYPANSLPKGILRKESRTSMHTVPDDELLEEYNIYMSWFLDFYKLKSERAAVRCGKYFEITEAIKSEFENRSDDKKYNVRKMNKITIGADDYADVMNFTPDKKEKKVIQNGFKRIMLNMIWDTIQRRCTSDKQYKVELDYDEKIELIRFFMILQDESNCVDEKLREQARELQKQMRIQMEQVGEDILKADAAEVEP